MKTGTLIGAILYKEIVKMRIVWPLLFAFNAAFMGWLFVSVRQLFRADHPEVVWYRVMHLGQVHYTAMRYLPLCVGVAFACLQFLPEMRDERLRLSLHLPTSSNGVILTHLAAGLFVLGIIYLFDTAALLAMTIYYFPAGVVSTTLLTFAPWVLAGVTGYMGTTLALLEPGLKQRVFILAVTAGLVSAMTMRSVPGSFANGLPLFLLVIPLLLIAALLPGYHFRHRRVDL